MTSPNDILRIGNLEIDLSSYRLRQDGDLIRLTPTEWALLRELLLHPGQVLSHRVLLQRVWGLEYGVESDYVHTYISRLRRKLEVDKNNPRYIMTEPGIGYWFDVYTDAESSSAATPAKVTLPSEGDPIDAMMQSISRVQTASGTDKFSPRFINPLPQDVRQRYVGRERERDFIRRMLHENAPLVSIYGRGGVGKTALACKVLGDLQEDPAFAGMVYLSANSTGINLGRILTDFSKLFGKSWEALEPTWNEQRPAQKISRLLESLNSDGYILLLDNLEELQHPTTSDLTDPEIDLFLRLVLQQEHTLRVVVTSRYPLNLPLNLKARERVISLEQGLPLAESVQLLRSCDPDNAAKIRDASEEQLQRIVERTGGLPRALEAVVGVLLVLPLLSLDALIVELSQHVDDIGADMVGQIINHLEEPSQLLMQVASAFQHPFTQDAIKAVAAPFIPADLTPMLNDLVRGYFLNYNAAARLFSLHPIDEAHCYSRIPEVSASGFTRASIHHHIADYYAAKIPTALASSHLSAESQSSSTLWGRGTAANEQQMTKVPHVPPLLDDLNFPLKELQHRILAGEYDTAARLLIPLDEQYLSRQGQYADLHDFYSDLQGKVQDRELSRRVLLRHAEVFRAMGRLHDARTHYEQARQAAQSSHDEAAALSGLGWTYYDLGNFDLAVSYLEQALTIFKEANDQPGMGNAYGGLGWVSYLRGDYPEATDYFKQALTIFRTLSDEYGVAVNLGDLGVVEMARGELNASTRHLMDALEMAERLNATREKSYKGRYLATLWVIHDRLDEALAVALKTSHYDIPVNQPSVEALLGVIMTLQDDFEEAARAFKSAIHHADRVLKYQYGLYDVRYARALAYAGLCVVEGTDIEQASEAYLSAKSVCAQKGVVDANLRLLEALTARHNALLPAVQILKGDSTPPKRS